jgi:hypothetical protein
MGIGTLILKICLYFTNEVSSPKMLLPACYLSTEACHSFLPVLLNTVELCIRILDIGLQGLNLDNIVMDFGPAGVFFGEAHRNYKNNLLIFLVFLGPPHIPMKRFY